MTPGIDIGKVTLRNVVNAVRVEVTGRLDEPRVGALQEA